MRYKTRHTPAGLTARERFCILIASSLAAGKREQAFKFMKKGLRAGQIPEKLLSELLLHLSLLLGFPAMLDAFQAFRTAAKGRPRTNRSGYHAASLRIQGERTMRRIYGKTFDRLLANMTSLHELIPEIVIRDAYGRIISRRGFSLRERELVNVAVLTIQGLQQQLYSHLRGALRLGVGSGTIQKTIRLASRTAGNNPGEYLRLLSNLTRQKRQER